VRILFFGTPEIAIPCLEKVCTNFKVVGVVCPPDRPSGRHLRLTPPPIKVSAEKMGLPVFQPENVNDPIALDIFRELKPDLGVVFAFGSFLKKDLLNLPTVGYMINLHPSLLPRWRGPSPIQTAIIEGDKETGVTVMKISMKMDAGDILLQRKVPIDENENALELSEKLSHIGADLMVEAIHLINSGKAIFIPQDESKATYCHLIEKKDGIIHWAWDAQRIHNLVRGCIPWPIAFTKLNGEIIRIHKTEIVHYDHNIYNSEKPGTILEIKKDKCLVNTGKGVIGICMLQAPNRKPLPFNEYIKGNHLQVGELFEDIV